MNQHCYPCAIRYDYIVKAETSVQDAEIIYEKSLIGNVTEARVKPKNPTSYEPELLYKNVSKSLVDKIYHLYEEDFRIFGYRPDDARNIAKNETLRRRRRKSRPSTQKIRTSQKCSGVMH